MSQWLKQSTAVKVRIGPVVAVGDGFTPVTNLAVGTADEAEVLKHDGAAVTDISGGTFAAITSCDGWYDLSMTTGYTDTLGLLDVVINDDSLCLPVFARFMVVPANVWDSLFSTDKLQVDAVEISSDSAAADNVEAAYDGTGYIGGSILPQVDVKKWNNAAVGRLSDSVKTT